jgi:hypothetical protein
MSEKGKHQHTAKRPPQKKALALTPEEQAEIRAASEKRVAEAKAERERVELFGKAVVKMSDRQLRGELSRAVKREYAGKPPQPQAGLTILYSTVLLTVLENTKTPQNPWAKLEAYPR